MTKWRTWLSHPRLPVIVALLAVLFTLPSLGNGLNLDDNIHRLILLGDNYLSPRSSSPLNLFCFSDGNVEENIRLMNIGVFPWWTSERLKLVFFRPLSALTHWLDYQLWPDMPLLMHVQSLLWFGVLICLVAFFYRRIMGTTWATGLAALLFAVDGAHGSLAGWLASRNVLLAGVFATLCLITHDRWRREKWRKGIVLAPACFALALLSAEAGISTGAYLLAHALFLESSSLKDRIVCLLPYILVLFLWYLVYSLLGCGAQDVPIYIDPLKDPLTYLMALFFRAPAYLLGQWLFPPVFCYLFWPSIIYKIALVFTMFLILIFAPLIRRDPIARFWTAGMLFSLLPICSAQPHDRNLLFVGLGTMGLLAQWFFWISQAEWNLKSRLWCVTTRTLIVLFILIHAVLAPLRLPVSALMFALMDKGVEQVSASLPYNPEYKNRKFVLVNNPSSLFCVINVCWNKAVKGQFIPLRSLTSGDSPLILRCIDLRTIEIRAEKGSLTDIDTIFVRNKRFSMHPGQRVELNDMSIEILEVNDGLPTAAKFLFSVHLNDSGLAWFRWQDNRYVPFTPPAVGETITIEGARFRM